MTGSEGATARRSGLRKLVIAGIVTEPASHHHLRRLAEETGATLVLIRGADEVQLHRSLAQLRQNLAPEPPSATTPSDSLSTSRAAAARTAAARTAAARTAAAAAGTGVLTAGLLLLVRARQRRKLMDAQEKQEKADIDITGTADSAVAGIASSVTGEEVLTVRAHLRYRRGAVREDLGTRTWQRTVSVRGDSGVAPAFLADAEHAPTAIVIGSGIEADLSLDPAAIEELDRQSGGGNHSDRADDDADADDPILRRHVCVTPLPTGDFTVEVAEGAVIFAGGGPRIGPDTFLLPGAEPVLRLGRGVYIELEVE